MGERLGFSILGYAAQHSPEVFVSLSCLHASPYKLLDHDRQGGAAWHAAAPCAIQGRHTPHENF
ncbi:MAG: hypothetical protein J4F42_09115 [Desulfurellaceae bacterium]|nr:hypothetical protein [Desulfurellaceae bacterium]